MRRISRGPSTPSYIPDYIAKSLLEVDFKALSESGIKYIAFDADSTLVDFRAKSLPTKTRLYLQKQRPLFKEWCIASNRITNDLAPLGKSIDAEVIRATLITRKPSRRFFKRVINHFGAHPKNIAMIGDKLIADMFGAKKSGLITVWVEKIGRDNILDRLFGTRFIERWMTRSYNQ